MKMAKKLALAGFLLHAAVDIGFLLMLCSVSHGERQLGIFALLACTFDAAWMLPLDTLLPAPLNEWLFGLPGRLFPSPYGIHGAIILISLPIGGAVYACVGWSTGRFLDLRRSATLGRRGARRRRAYLAPLVLLIAFPIMRPLYEDIRKIDGFTPESAVRHYLQTHLSYPKARTEQVTLSETSDPQFNSSVRLYLVKEDGTVLARIGVHPHMRVAWRAGYSEKADSQPWAKPGR